MILFDFQNPLCRSTLQLFRNREIFKWIFRKWNWSSCTWL